MSRSTAQREYVGLLRQLQPTWSFVQEARDAGGGAGGGKDASGGGGVISTLAAAEEEGDGEGGQVCVSGGNGCPAARGGKCRRLHDSLVCWQQSRRRDGRCSWWPADQPGWLGEGLCSRLSAFVTGGRRCGHPAACGRQQRQRSSCAGAAGQQWGGWWDGGGRTGRRRLLPAALVRPCHSCASLLY